jgi:hypothetical protein
MRQMEWAQVAQAAFRITEFWELLLLVGQQMVAMERQATIQLLGFTKLVVVAAAVAHTQLAMVVLVALEDLVLVVVVVAHHRMATLVLAALEETDS